MQKYFLWFNLSCIYNFLHYCYIYIAICVLIIICMTVIKSVFNLSKSFFKLQITKCNLIIILYSNISYFPPLSFFTVCIIIYPRNVKYLGIYVNSRSLSINFLIKPSLPTGSSISHRDVILFVNLTLSSNESHPKYYYPWLIVGYCTLLIKQNIIHTDSRNNLALLNGNKYIFANTKTKK